MSFNAFEKGRSVMDLLYVLALLACPVGMGAMMWFMMRGKGHSDKADAEKAREHPQDAEIARLRAEVHQLRAAAQESPHDARRQGERR